MVKKTVDYKAEHFLWIQVQFLDTDSNSLAMVGVKNKLGIVLDLQLYFRTLNSLFTSETFQSKEILRSINILVYCV
jgi:hypothetical protein